MIRRIAIVAIAAVFLGLLGFVFFVVATRYCPRGAPEHPASFTAESISKGEALAAVGHCVSCHSRPGGQPFAGGYGVNTPFGIIYGSNITPDPTTGIGLWSLEAFTRAMREGVARDAYAGAEIDNLDRTPCRKMSGSALLQPSAKNGPCPLGSHALLGYGLTAPAAMLRYRS
jgi:hypothetical protein